VDAQEFGHSAAAAFSLTGHYYGVMACALFLFQAVFMDRRRPFPRRDAERWRIASFAAYGLFMSIVLPGVRQLGWGGGWLSSLGGSFGLGNGYVDFAGSGVVHTGWWVVRLGRRHGPGREDRQVQPGRQGNAIPGHHIPMAVLGTLILAFGWFGFNPGSTWRGQARGSSGSVSLL